MSTREDRREGVKSDFVDGVRRLEHKGPRDKSEGGGECGGGLALVSEGPPSTENASGTTGTGPYQDRVHVHA